MTKAVVTTTTAIRRAQLQSNRHHQRTNIQLFMCQKPLLSPNQQCQNTEEISITIHTLARELNWESSVLAFDHKSLLVTFGEGCQASRQPSGANTPRTIITLLQTNFLWLLFRITRISQYQKQLKMKQLKRHISTHCRR